MKSKKKGYRFVVFSCGYAESSMTSTLVYGTPFLGNKKFATRGEAIIELALDLYTKFEGEQRQRHSRQMSQTCCENYRNIKEKNYKYCPKCGGSLEHDEFDAEKFKEFIVGLHSTNCDSYGEAEWFEGRDPEFWPWSFCDFLKSNKSEMVYIAESAECVLLAALCDAKPELKQYVDPYFEERDWEEQFKLDKQPSYR